MPTDREHDEAKPAVWKSAPGFSARMDGCITKAGTPGYDNTLGPREVRVLASTPMVDFAKEIVSPMGLQPNPADVPVYFNHNSSAPDALPIGRAYLRATPSGVVGTIVFAPAGDDPFADRVCAACKSGVVDAVSVGFTPLTTSRSKDGKILTYLTWEINELSVVGVGMNSQARITQRGLSRSNPDRDARIKRAAEVMAKAERMEKAWEQTKKGFPTAAQLAATLPHPVDTMTAAERRSYAQTVISRNAQPAPQTPPTLYEAESRRAAAHAAAVGALQQPNTKAARVIRAGRLVAPHGRIGGLGNL